MQWRNVPLSQRTEGPNPGMCYPGHCQNLMNERPASYAGARGYYMYDYVGVGAADCGDGTIMFTALFAQLRRPGTPATRSQPLVCPA